MSKKYQDGCHYNHDAFVGSIEVRHAHWFDADGIFPGMKGQFIIEMRSPEKPGRPSLYLATDSSPAQLRELAKQMLAAADDFEAHQAEIMESEQARGA